GSPEERRVRDRDRHHRLSAGLRCVRRCGERRKTHDLHRRHVAVRHRHDRCGLHRSLPDSLPLDHHAQYSAARSHRSQNASGLPPFGVMFQGGALFGSLTVGENVSLPLEEWTELPADAIAAIARAKLRLVGLDGAADKLPSELSGGMKKRAAIARAIALEPEIVFL